MARYLSNVFGKIRRARKLSDHTDVGDAGLSVSLMPLFVTGYVIIITTEAQVAFSIGITVTALYPIWEFLYLITYMIEKHKGPAGERNLHHEQEYYRELEHNQKEIRRLRHDMNNHLAAGRPAGTKEGDGESPGIFCKAVCAAAGRTKFFL